MIGDGIHKQNKQFIFKQKIVHPSDKPIIQRWVLGDQNWTDIAVASNWTGSHTPTQSCKPRLTVLVSISSKQWFSGMCGVYKMLLFSWTCARKIDDIHQLHTPSEHIFVYLCRFQVRWTQKSKPMFVHLQETIATPTSVIGHPQLRLPTGRTSWIGKNEFLYH